MPTDEERKRKQKFVNENTSAWERFTTSITPGDVSERYRNIEQKAHENYQEKQKQAQLEALRKKRMNAGGG